MDNSAAQTSSSVCQWALAQSRHRGRDRLHRHAQRRLGHRRFGLEHREGDQPAGIRCYSATYGPVGSIVHSLMLTKHLLVVGTSLTDDNFLRLAYEVSNYLNAAPGGSQQTKEPFGTVLSLRADATKQQLWDGTFYLVGASDEPDPVDEGWTPDDAEQARKITQDRRARDLSIMLDYIAMEASLDNYLLDPRYRALLKPEEQTAAERASALAAAMNAMNHSGAEDTGWKRLHDVLRELGDGAVHRGPAFQSSGEGHLSSSVIPA